MTALFKIDAGPQTQLAKAQIGEHPWVSNDLEVIRFDQAHTRNRGELKEFDAETGRYTVLLENGKTFQGRTLEPVKAAYLVWWVGGCVGECPVTLHELADAGCRFTWQPDPSSPEFIATLSESALEVHFDLMVSGQ